MRLALMADIHANREAFEACLADAAARRAERLVLLGDYVNYGADPDWVVGAIMDRVAKGLAVALRGNHDAAVAGRNPTMDSSAESALEWTRNQLGADQRAFLAALPLTVEEGDCLFVHADASAPGRWTYVTDAADAARSLKATHRRVTFCGHVHRPAVYNMSETLKLITFRPVPGVAIPLLPQRRWLAVMGSVGQPRDGNPAACWALVDTARAEITYHRVPYEVDEAAKKIRRAALPEMYAERLTWGQ
ncbi:MAG TPA: metallophosphoesterase family protein [Thermoanaerobaculia bacterium]|nr:metallophosphoesterase family protein [Thermoanaerobaculia bacterium]